MAVLRKHHFLILKWKKPQGCLQYIFIKWSYLHGFSQYNATFLRCKFFLVSFLPEESNYFEFYEDKVLHWAYATNVPCCWPLSARNQAWDTQLREYPCTDLPHTGNMAFLVLFAEPTPSLRFSGKSKDHHQVQQEFSTLSPLYSSLKNCHGYTNNIYTRIRKWSQQAVL